jgi:hypothetical protein
MKRSMILVVAISFVVTRQATGGMPTILNGDFEGPFIPQGDDLVPEHWGLHESPLDPGETSILTSSPDNGPALPGKTSVEWSRTNGGQKGDATGIIQIFDPPIDVSQLTEPLTLSLDVKAISHNLCGSGWDPSRSEYPVRADVIFWDLNDVLKYWSYGWYIWTGEPCPTPPYGLILEGGNGIVYSEQIPAGVWVSATFDLLAQLRTLAEPKSIYALRVVGAGWDFDGGADNIRFEAPTSVAQTTWGSVKSLYR